MGSYHLEDLGVNGRIILKWSLKKVSEGLDWVNLSKDKDKWCAVVNSFLELQLWKMQAVS